MATRASQEWSPTSWRAFPALQQPQYKDASLLASCLQDIGSRPPLVHHGEILALRKQIAEAGEGRRFVLQAGDCANPSCASAEWRASMPNRVPMTSKRLGA
jgi:3-deoxy-7-phosphoheptulonate synthase